MQISRQVFLGMAGMGTALAAMLVWFAGYQYGPRFTYDSINYIYAGHALLEKGEFLRPFGQPYIEWPPLYPLLIAFLDLFPGNLLLKILFAQILIITVTVAVSIRLAYGWIKETLIFIVFCLAIIFSTPLLVVNHFVWSESLFCLLTVIQLGLLLQYVYDPKPLSLIDLMLAGMLVCLQRHVGVFFIIGTSLAIVLFAAKLPVARRLLSGILYGITSLIPLLLWWARNYMVKGQIMNDYSETLLSVDIGEHFLAFHRVFTTWFLPGKLPVVLSIGLLYAIIISLLVYYIRYTVHARPALTTESTKPKLHSLRIQVLAVFFMSYFLLTYAASFTVNEFIDDRILAPVYIPGMLLFFGVIDHYVQTLQTSWLRKSIMYLCLLWTLYPIARTFHYVYLWHSQPVYLPFSQPVEEKLKYLYQF